MTDSVSHRNRSINFMGKSMDWFLYDRSTVMKELIHKRLEVNLSPPPVVSWEGETLLFCDF